LPLAVAWTVGASGATALTDGRVSGWVPDAGVLVSAATMAVVLLAMRALDDIRDLDYDREHNPGRPLASGVVTVRDLLALVAGSAAVALLLNAWRWPVLCVLAGLFGYAFAVVWVDRRFGRPSGDAMIAGLLVSLPVQLLTNVFLYTGLLYSLDLGPAWSGGIGVLVATLAFLHVEFARKTTRAPRPGERTYVTVLGTTGTAALAVGCAAGSVALLLITARPWHAAVLLALLPLAYPLLAAVRFRRQRLARWPYGLAAGFVMTAYAGFAVVAVLQGVLS
jgi:4-hydroxybenzoate polyprenyltransferase